MCVSEINHVKISWQLLVSLNKSVIGFVGYFYNSVNTFICETIRFNNDKMLVLFCMSYHCYFMCLLPVMKLRSMKCRHNIHYYECFFYWYTLLLAIFLPYIIKSFKTILCRFYYTLYLKFLYGSIFKMDLILDFHFASSVYN